MRSDGHQPDEDELGPVDYLAVEFPGGRITAPGFGQLMSLVRQGTIRILDAEFVVKDAAGSTRRADVSDLGGAGGADLSAWAGASSGLLDEPTWVSSPRRSSLARPPRSSCMRIAGCLAWLTPGGGRARV